MFYDAVVYATTPINTYFGTSLLAYILDVSGN